MEAQALIRIFGVSERRVCKVTGLVRTTLRYKSRKDSQAALRLRIRELAMARPRYGYRRLHTLLKREGWRVNHKRVLRLYTEEGLQVRVKRRKKLAAKPRVKPPAASRINERWSMDFMSDYLADGRRIRLLTVIDVFTRECLALKVARSIPARAVTAALDQVVAERGPPRVIQVDNGSEFTSNHFDAWAYMRNVQIDFIQPGKPVQNCHIESFNGSVRDELLNTSWFETLDDARRGVQAWRDEYNVDRPHSSLGDESPSAFASKLRLLEVEASKRNP